MSGIGTCDAAGCDTRLDTEVFHPSIDTGCAAGTGDVLFFCSWACLAGYAAAMAEFAALS